MGQLGQTQRVVDQQIDELLIPLRVVEAATLAMHLMGHAAGGDNGHLQVFGIAFNRATQGLAQLIAAQRTGDRELQHTHLQRHDLHRPRRITRQERRHRREKPMVQRLVAEETHVEFIGHQALTNVPRQRGMPAHCGQRAWIAAFVGDLVTLIDAEGERAIVVEEKRRHMVVEDVEQHIRLLLLQPHLDRFEAFENRRPRRLILFIVIDGEADGRCMGYSEATDNTCHDEFLCSKKIIAPARPG
ncbi:hypothetical protein D3C78_1176550 [compost metagenome]